jgi:hypothetical protein
MIQTPSSKSTDCPASSPLSSAGSHHCNRNIRLYLEGRGCNNSSSDKNHWQLSIQQKGPLGKPRNRWENINAVLKKEEMMVSTGFIWNTTGTIDMLLWTWDLNFWVLQKTTNFLISWVALKASPSIIGSAQNIHQPLIQTSDWWMKIHKNEFAEVKNWW